MFTGITNEVTENLVTAEDRGIGLSQTTRMVKKNTNLPALRPTCSTVHEERSIKKDNLKKDDR